MFIVKHRTIFYWISAVLVVGAIAAISVWGLNLGIDFRGGSLLEINYPNGRPAPETIKSSLESLRLVGGQISLGEISVRETGQNGFLIRLREVSGQEKTAVMETLSKKTGAPIEEKRFDSVGPILGKEAAIKSLWAIALVLLLIIAFIALAFRKVSEPVPSWKYGIIAVLALLHDVLIPTGVFAVFGHFRGFEIDTLFVTALLVILGFSVHDTIVVFDRVRENLKTVRLSHERKNFEAIVGESIKQTFVRSINTSLTTVLALIVLYFFGPESTRLFSLALIIGVVVGTYSSIFIASTLLVTIEKWQNRKRGV